jgi:hypothetical protein
MGMILEQLGMLPFFIDPQDPRPAREQLDANYQHGGGWVPVEGFERDERNGKLYFPGDPPMSPIAFMRLRDEMVVFYPFAFVAVVQKDGAFEVARMD